MNTFTSITPTTGAIGSSYSIAGTAGKVKTGAAGMLYSYNTANVVPFSTSTFLGSTPITVAANREILDIAVAPDNAARFAMTIREPGTANYGGIYHYTSGVQTAALPTGIGGSIAYGATGSRLYSLDNLTSGYGYYRYDLAATSISQASVQSTSIQAVDAITFNAGRTVTVGGEVLNAETGATLGHVDPSNMGPGTAQAILFDAANNRGFGVYYNSFFARYELHAYTINNDTNSFTWSQLGSTKAFPSFTSVDNLVLAGPNRLAVTVGTQIWIMDVTPVPEPSAMMAAGVVMAFVFFRRKR
ncbi:hypothetical protein BH11PLA2_BH11PLA2_12780 [soil metagenome]